MQRGHFPLWCRRFACMVSRQAKRPHHNGSAGDLFPGQNGVKRERESGRQSRAGLIGAAKGGRNTFSHPNGLRFCSPPVHEPGQVISGDPVVDINDLTVVLTHFGQTGCTWSQGCMDGDPTGTVDVNDLTIVLANFGTTYGASTDIKAVPEPSCIALLGAAAVVLFASAWRRRSSSR
jgi:hypothetical protein